MSALLAYGYILSGNSTGEWDLKSPTFNEDTYEMNWPDWVDPEDPMGSLGDKLFAARTNFKYAHLMGGGDRPDDYYDEMNKAHKAAPPSKVELCEYGNFSWDEVPVLLYVSESSREADDGPIGLENFAWAGGSWSTWLHDALEIMEIEPNQPGPMWILAPHYSS